MKRSKALKIIIEQWKDSTSFPADELVANYILRALEEAGMSPPDWDNTVYGHNEGYISPPKWEPEDE